LNCDGLPLPRGGEECRRRANAEVLLGIIPGAGEYAASSALCGAELALVMCTDGKSVPAPKAAAAGIIDAIVPGVDDLATRRDRVREEPGQPEEGAEDA